MSLDDLLAGWPVSHAAAIRVGDTTLETSGDIDRPFELASVTKLITAMVALVAHEEGTLPLDLPIGEKRATPADLLAHSTGTRRNYSTDAYDDVADAIAHQAEMPFATYAAEAILQPLAMTSTTIAGSAGAGAWASVRDLLALTTAWRSPILIHEDTLARATSPHRPELDGLLPGYGRQSPNLWGLGPEIRGHKWPHWTSTHNSPTTFGHFGQSGTMIWIDPVNNVTCIALADHPFGPWAIDAWPPLSDYALGVS
ncbi:MAG: CubicO group peptidase (beta-lactamase class C family) [Candidatus Aldehydirespiratoraceae bacterium]|jgi:CubicO group peptidase (beta-lactamase class C family)